MLKHIGFQNEGKTVRETFLSTLPTFTQQAVQHSPTLRNVGSVSSEALRRPGIQNRVCVCMPEFLFGLAYLDRPSEEAEEDGLSVRPKSECRYTFSFGVVRFSLSPLSPCIPFDNRRGNVIRKRGCCSRSFGGQTRSEKRRKGGFRLLFGETGGSWACDAHFGHA